MNDFIENPASITSISARKMVFGFGLNDADYITETLVEGKRVQCPYYRRWMSMFSRCYSKAYQSSNPSYIGCYVCHEWRSFTAFKTWMKTQDWQGKELDKDILIDGNKEYSPNTCQFVTGKQNRAHSNSKQKKDSSGVDMVNGKYRARKRLNGKRYHIGTFNSKDDAIKAYKNFSLSV